MKPVVTPIGSLFDRVGEVCTPRELVSYSVGDWVWAKGHGKNERLFRGKGERLFLARIESATPIRTVHGEEYAVRIYRARRGWQLQVEHRFIKCALNPAEVAHNRKLGLIPPSGQGLP